MNKAVLFSSASDVWETPQALFDAQHAIHRFTLDGAADATNHKLPRWFGPGGEREDALAAVDWPQGERVWINPPYSRGSQAKFITKAWWEVTEGHIERAVLLLPSRTDTRVFHNLIWEQSTRAPYPWVDDLNFLPGRLKFVGAKDAAPFPSLLVVFRLPETK